MLLWATVGCFQDTVIDRGIRLSSRSDAYFADQDPFNATVWAETTSYFTTEMITIQQLADARMGRLVTSQATNPNFTLSGLADGFSWGECASFFEILADGTTGTVNRTFIDYWFRKHLPSLHPFPAHRFLLHPDLLPILFKSSEFLFKYFSLVSESNMLLGNERMPTEIGWTRRPTTMPSSEREYYTMLLMEAAGVSPGPPS
jgi:hypothetical protein